MKDRECGAGTCRKSEIQARCRLGPGEEKEKKVGQKADLPAPLPKTRWGQAAQDMSNRLEHSTTAERVVSQQEECPTWSCLQKFDPGRWRRREGREGRTKEGRTKEENEEGEGIVGAREGMDGG
jgi:hypothetical protein